MLRISSILLFRSLVYKLQSFDEVVVLSLVFFASPTKLVFASPSATLGLALLDSLSLPIRLFPLLGVLTSIGDRPCLGGFTVDASDGEAAEPLATLVAPWY